MMNFVFIATLFVSAFSAPLDTLSSSTEQLSSNIQKIPSSNNGLLLRPSPINPNIPSEPKPDEPITIITPSTSTDVNDDSSNRDDIIHPPSLHAYEKLSNNTGSPHKVSKRSDSSALDRLSVEKKPAVVEQNKKNPIPTTLATQITTKPVPGYKREKRSTNDDQFETSHHIPAYIQQQTKNPDVNNQAQPITTDSLEKKQPKRELPKETKLPSDQTSVIDEQNNDNVKKTKLQIPLTTPIQSGEHHQNKRDESSASISSSSKFDANLDKFNRSTSVPVSSTNSQLDESVSGKVSISTSTDFSVPKKRDTAETVESDNEPVYVHPVPVSQIVKNSQAAPEIHLVHNPDSSSTTTTKST